MSAGNTSSTCTGKNCCIFNSTEWNKTLDLPSLVLIEISLILAFIIILSNALHTASTRNTIIIILTLILMIIGVVILTIRGDWYEQVITAIVPLVVLILASILGERMIGSEGKWRKILFIVCCALVAVGIVCSILCIICKNTCKVSCLELST
ncbi:unnamed protein product [Schistosoma turkestanicum]|nr:unnamed protein product [Schistosoma turkestanicum]